MLDETKPKIKMLTIKEAVELTNQPDNRIRQWCITGELQHVRAGKKHLINEAVLLDFLGQPT